MIILNNSDFLTDTCHENRPTDHKPHCPSPNPEIHATEKMPSSRPVVVRALLQGISMIIPPILLAEVFVIGLFPTLWHMLRHPRSIPFPNRWRDSFQHAAQPFLPTMSDSVFSDQKRRLVAQAKGRVLEVGAGTGCNLKYYDKDKVEIIYGVEPDLPALDHLEKEIAKRDLIDKYKILPFGIDETDKVSEAEITPGSIDTVVCVFLSHLEYKMPNNRCCVFVQSRCQSRSCLPCIPTSNLAEHCLSWSM